MGLVRHALILVPSVENLNFHPVCPDTQAYISLLEKSFCFKAPGRFYCLWLALYNRTTICYIQRRLFYGVRSNLAWPWRNSPPPNPFAPRHEAHFPLCHANAPGIAVSSPPATTTSPSSLKGMNSASGDFPPSHTTSPCDA